MVKSSVTHRLYSKQIGRCCHNQRDVWNHSLFWGVQLWCSCTQHTGQRITGWLGILHCRFWICCPGTYGLLAERRFIDLGTFRSQVWKLGIIGREVELFDMVGSWIASRNCVNKEFDVCLKTFKLKWTYYNVKVEIQREQKIRSTQWFSGTGHWCPSACCDVRWSRGNSIGCARLDPEHHILYRSERCFMMMMDEWEP